MKLSPSRGRHCLPMAGRVKCPRRSGLRHRSSSPAFRLAGGNWRTELLLVSVAMTTVLENLTTPLGPRDAGLMMTLDEFEEADFEPGYRY